jgi:hypothetical protein
MARLTREQILNAKDIVQEEVEVKAWGGSVLVQSLSGAQRAAVMKVAMGKNGKVDAAQLYPLLMIEGVVEPKFSKADIEALNDRSSGALETVCKVIMRLSGISQDDIEEEEKNS